MWLPRNHKQHVFCNRSPNTFLEKRAYPISAKNSHLNDLNFTIYGHPWHHERLWSYIWLQINHELELFSKFQPRLFTTKKHVRGTYFTLFQPTFEILYGQLYGCQVFLVTIYGLDMVAKIYLWWSTREEIRIMERVLDMQLYITNYNANCMPQKLKKLISKQNNKNCITCK